MKFDKIIKSTFCAVLLCGSLFGASHGTHWGYTGHDGAQNWGNLAPEYSTCKDGKNQSPINISKGVTITTNKLEDIDFNYKSRTSDIVNNGHTIQVNVKEGSSIKVDGIEFYLKQLHFHTPSENQIEGKNFPLEAHFVHVSKKGEIAVVALMFENGKENQTIKDIWDRMPRTAGDKECYCSSTDVLNSFLPKNRSYYRFTGSLTTPPCSEGVRWFVLKHYSTISEAQTKEFLEVMHHENNRPIQDINARKVLLNSPISF